MPTKTQRRRGGQALSPRLRAVLARLCEQLGPMYSTRAVKLPYLVDVVAKQVLGQPIAKGTYQAWDHGVVTKEVYRFIKYEAEGDDLFRVQDHPYSESGKKIGLAKKSGEQQRVLTARELAVVDFVAETYGHLPYDELGILTKRLNTEIPPEEWGSNRPAAVDDEAFLRLSPQWQNLCERISTADFTDVGRCSEPITGSPREFFRRLLNA